MRKSSRTACVSSIAYETDWLTGASNAGSPALTETFTYSATGNLLSRTRLTGTFAYPAMTATRPHAPLSLGARSFAYDANGNTTGDGVRTLTWDPGSRLSQVTQSGQPAVAFAYGPDSVRVKKAVSGGATTLYPSADAEYAGSTWTRYPHIALSKSNALLSTWRTSPSRAPVSARTEVPP